LSKGASSKGASSKGASSKGASSKGASSKLVAISRRLATDVDALTFAPPVAYVYDPLTYARDPHERYLERYGAAPKEVVLVGMNPGPFGMAQTGVPFGDPTFVKSWLSIEGEVGKPPKEHPKRLITGFACKRSEVSGTRVWSWARDRFGTPERFFARFFIHNYCPLVFMEDSGRNRVPEKLAASEREALFAACDRALKDTIEVLAPQVVVGVGKFAEERARAVLGSSSAPRIGRILHPSPASPLANQGWAGLVDLALAELGIALP
jgi:single-strand selective monofunctional uracil DNA glycosylase